MVAGFFTSVPPGEPASALLTTSPNNSEQSPSAGEEPQTGPVAALGSKWFVNLWRLDHDSWVQDFKTSAFPPFSLLSTSSSLVVLSVWSRRPAASPSAWECVRNADPEAPSLVGEWKDDARETGRDRRPRLVVLSKIEEELH